MAAKGRSVPLLVARKHGAIPPADVRSCSVILHVGVANAAGCDLAWCPPLSSIQDDFDRDVLVAPCHVVPT